MLSVSHLLNVKRLRFILLAPAATTLLAGCPLIGDSSSSDEEEGSTGLRMLFNTQCASSTCNIDTGATYDNNSDISQVLCDMGDGTVINVAELELNFDYTYAAPGEYDVTCIVTSSDGTTDSLTTTVLVTGLFADAGPDVNVLEGQSVVLDGSGSVDESGNGITYQWTKITGPVGFFLDDSTIESPTFTAPAVEGTTVFVYQLRVDNGIEDSVSDTMSITVQESDFTDLPL